MIQRRLVAFLPTILAVLLPAAPAFAETLAEATAIAIRRHPTLKADQATVRSADENVTAARSDLFPTVSLIGEVNVDSYTRTAGALDLQGREVGIRANQLLYDGLGVFNKLDAVQAERAALQADRDRNGNTVAFGVARAYLMVLRDRELVASAQRNVDEHRRSVTRLAAIVKYDAGKAFDLAQVRTREAFAESLYAERVGLLKRDEAAYLELVGQAPGQLAVPVNLNGEGFASQDQAVEVAQAKHPMVLAANHRAVGAQAATQQSRATLAPKLYATARYDTGVDRQGVRGWNTEGYAGLRASYAFGSGSLSAVRGVEQQAAASVARVDAARRSVREAVRIAWVQREGMIADLPPAEEALRQTLTVLEGFKTQYTFGRRTVLDLLIVQNDAFRAEARAVGLRFDRLMADYALAAQIGTLEGRLLADVPPKPNRAAAQTAGR